MRARRADLQMPEHPRFLGALIEGKIDEIQQDSERWKVKNSLFLLSGPFLLLRYRYFV